MIPLARFHRPAALLAVPALALMLAFAGCTKPQAAASSADAGPMHAPASQTDDKAWKAYYQDVIKRHSEGVEGQTYAYYIPAPGAPDYEDKYGRQMQAVKDSVARGVLPGNMMAFMSPDSTKMADLIVEAFKKASPGSMKKVIVLFIGKAEDMERVKAAVEPAGVEFRYVEML